MIPPHAQLLTSPLPILFLPTTHFLKPCITLSVPANGASFIKPLITDRFGLKCSAASVVSEPPQLELSDEDRKPFPAEVTRTTVELSSVGTLSTLNYDDGSPLGFGIRFALDFNEILVLCLNDRFSADRRCSLHVQVRGFCYLDHHRSSFLIYWFELMCKIQLEQCGVRTP